MNKLFDFKNNPANSFLIVSSLVLVLIGILLFVYFEAQHKQAVLSDIEQQMSQTVLSDKTLLINNFVDNTADVRFLAGTPPIPGIIRASKNNGFDSKEDTPISLWQERLSKIFYSFMSGHPAIAQIRFIGKSEGGRELVRVERQHGTGAMRIVPKNQLQPKGDRDYFLDTAALKSGEVYISDFSLNREYGRLDYPLWPTYRVAVPIYDELGNFFGIIIINYNAQLLLDQFSNSQSLDMRVFLLNTNGQYLLHPEQGKAFAFDRNVAATNWSQDFVMASKQNQLQLWQVSGQDELVYTSESRVQLTGTDTDRHISIVVAMSENIVAQLISERRQANAITLLAILFVGAMIIFIYRKILVKEVDLTFAQSQYAALINSSRDAILTLTTEGLIEDWNDATFDVLKLPPTDLVGRQLTTIIDNNYESMINSSIQACLSGEAVSNLEVSRHISSGELLASSVALSPIRNAQNKIVGASTIIRDITEQVLVKQELEKLNRSLEEKVRTRTQELEIATKEALDASAMKSSFVANVSHEIRTPLNGIIGMHNLMRSGELDTKQSSYLAMATQSAKSLLMLINDILDLSKIEAGKLDIEKQPLNLIDNFSQSANSMSARALDKNVEIVLDIAEIKHPIVIGDGLRLRQILNNLISNAIKFTDRGEIVITANTVEDPVSHNIVLNASVRDTGIGIDKDKLDRLFKAFSQEDASTTRRFGGTGLGLSIVKNLCTMMDGNCAVQSEKGVGSTFSFQLSLTPSEDNKLSLNNIINLKPYTIQIAESRDSVRNALTKLLHGWGAKTLLSEQEHAESADIVISQLGENGIDDESVQQQLDQLAKNNYDEQFIFTLTFKQRHCLDDLNTKVTYQVVHRPILPIQLATALSELTSEPLGQFEASTEKNNKISFDRLAEFEGSSILIVDDNEINQRVAAGILEQWQFDIKLASNGQKALQLLQQDPQIKLILMDCQMPVMDGFGATAAIRRGDAGIEYKKIPIIAMTAGAMTGDREECLGAGMNDYLTKPISADDLLSKVSLWLQARAAKNKQPAVSPIMNNDTAKAERKITPTDEPDTDIAFWDRKASLDRLLSNEDLFLRMLEMFEQQTPLLIDEIDQHITQQDYTEVRKKAHKLKGSASAIGANRVLNAARQLENAAIEEQVQEITAAFEEAKQEAQRMYEAISEYQPQTPSEQRS